MNSILVRAPNWIGDQVLAYPFFHLLRRAYPRAKITSVCTTWTESIQFRNLVDEVVVLEKADKPGLLGKLEALNRAAAGLKKTGPYDQGFILPNSFSSAYMFWKAGVKVRTGYEGDGRKLLLSHALEWNPEIQGHRSASYIGLLPANAKPPGNFRATEFWGIPPEPGNEDLDPGVAPVVKFDPEKAWPQGSKEAQTLRFPVALDSKYWVLAPGSTAETRRWPLENFANLARKISSETGMPGVIVGGVSEMTIAERLSGDPDLNLYDFTARCSVAALWPLFRAARFTVANDSGLAHVASLCGSPVQVVWGAGDPKRTEPLGPGRVRVLFNPVDCWPCEKNLCSQVPAAKLICIRGIQSDEVWEEMKSGLRI